MSSRNAERSKAVRLAWEREQKLVREGKCTRDWTKEQQQDILDPEKGKAYDDQGRSFEGQHMKSVRQYPEHADNPDNIQFLTKDEHLEAHKGNWQNPSNWYYNPTTKEFTDFGDGEIIPCKIINLSAPIVALKVSDFNALGNRKDSEKKQKATNKSILPIVDKTRKENTSVIKATLSIETIIKRIKKAGGFIAKHPMESIQIAGFVIEGATKTVPAIKRKKNTGREASAFVKSDTAKKIADVIEKANKTSPREHVVPGHKQHYHTKKGTVLKDKDPYPRGGKDS